MTAADLPAAAGEYASAQEARAALEGLSAVDLAKLQVIARFFCKRRLSGTQATWEDLLHEAIVRTLSGARRWRRARVTIVQHLDRVMESLSGHLAGQDLAAEGTAQDDDPTEEPDLRHWPAPFQSTVEAAASAREDRASVLEMFTGDDEALRVLECRAKGMRGEEICQALCLNKASYGTISRRILRSIMKFTED